MESVTPDKILTFCLDIIGKYALYKIEISSDEAYPDIYFVQNEKPVNTLSRKSTHNRYVPAIHLKNGFYLYWGIAFEKTDRTKRKTGYKFKGVSLQIFNKKSLLFRAEWDNKDENQTTHPQPHWHIEPITFFSEKEIEKEIQKTFMELIEEASNGFQDYIKIKDNKQEEKEFHYEKFHFAMSAKWHENEPKRNIPFTEKNLRYWLDMCLNSIDLQLKYVSK